MLENPETEIINKGGFIFFAEYENEIVGTAALINHSDSVFELAKMAVNEKVQGKQIGKKLAQAAINKVMSLNADLLFLETNSKLLPALNLYKNLGFNEVEMKVQSEYSRATLRMELEMKKVNEVLI
jgi:N-acetylglutamate synthase-like GNAT family acetyltransferase